jgi:RNA polymerase sigma factor (sigma-70 family)
LSLLTDAAAFEAFYREHARGVLRFFVRLTGDPHVSLDLTAETFARALRHRGRFRGTTPEEAAGWLFRIARNEHLQFVRKGKVEGRAVRRLGLVTPPFSEDDLARVRELADLDGVASEVRAGLQSLPESQREAVWLRVVDELPYREIASRLDISEQNARTRVSRGLLALEHRVPDPNGATT